MAASIPILRVLLQDVKKSLFSRQDYGSGQGGSHSRSNAMMPTLDNHKVVVTVRTNRSRRNSGGTEGSELDILKGGSAEETTKGVVVKSGYVVKYEEADWKGGRRGDDA
jgi:hypothetical protein